MHLGQCFLNFSNITLLKRKVLEALMLTIIFIIFFNCTYTKKLTVSLLSHGCATTIKPKQTNQCKQNYKNEKVKIEINRLYDKVHCVEMKSPFTRPIESSHANTSARLLKTQVSFQVFFNFKLCLML